MNDDCGLCARYKRGCQYHPDEDITDSETVTGAKLSPRQIIAVECLLSRALDETLAQVAERAEVTPRTLYRYMNDPDFMGEYRRRVEDELGAHRAKVAAALVKGAIEPSTGQASMQKLYWQRLGELVERNEVTGTVHHETIPLDRLRPETKRAILRDLEDWEREQRGEVVDAPAESAQLALSPRPPQRALPPGPADELVL